MDWCVQNRRGVPVRIPAFLFLVKGEITMKQETRNILETPFTTDQIKQRRGLWGKMLDYIPGHLVIHRLNEAFEADWSFVVTQYEVFDEEVVCMGKLTVGDVVKVQFGSSNITRDSETGKTLCLGDDLKGAATDSLKKCASLLGVGLHLYGDVSNGNGNRMNESSDQSGSNRGNGGNGGHHNLNPRNGNSNNGTDSRNNGNGNNNGLITPKQMRYILSLGRRQNMADNAVEELAEEWFGTPLSLIEKTQASQMITQLSA